ncbi:MAG: hypothetical protein HC872_04025 [Gammaproteobacteria bacterium]|nr:hypothetical protein [Gammaproteobacteria bacterium]
MWSFVAKQLRLRRHHTVAVLGNRTRRACGSVAAMRSQLYFRRRSHAVVATCFVHLALGFSCGYSRPEDVAGVGDPPPTVVFTEPAAFAAQVEVTTPIRVRFSTPIDALSASLTLEAAGLPVEGKLLAIDDDTLEFIPDIPLAKGMPYELLVAGIADRAGNATADKYSLAFTTVATACVKPAGSDGCFALLSTAVAASRPGDSIAVAAGAYSDSVVLDKTVNLLGGYDQGLTTRNPEANLTEISDRSSEYSLIEILTRDGETTNTSIVDGLTLTGHITVEHGGAIHADRSNPRIRNNVIYSNKGIYLGGGIYVSGDAHIARNRIEANSVQEDGFGAGIAIEGRAEIIDNEIVNNFVPTVGGGGGVYVKGVVTLRGNQIVGNRVADRYYVGKGGGVYAEGSSVIIQGGTINRNQVSGAAGTGSGAGAYFTANVEVLMEAVVVSENLTSQDASAGASGIHIDTSKFSMHSTIVTGNRGGTGGIVVGSNPSKAGSIINCTVNDNQTRGIWSTGDGDLSIRNTLITKEAVGIAVSGTGLVRIRTNAFFATNESIVGGILESASLTADPRLTADLRLMPDSPLIDAGVQRTTAEPGGALEPSFIDIDGDPRVLSGFSGNSPVPDIGADEYRPAQ